MYITTKLSLGRLVRGTAMTARVLSHSSHTLKVNVYICYKDHTVEEVKQAVEQYMYFYNFQRFQKRLNHLAPIEYRYQMVA